MLARINVGQSAVNSAIIARESEFIADRAREMMNLHVKYGHNATLQGETAYIKEWYANKGNENGETLANLLSKHPNWIPEKNYIVFPYEFTREIDRSEVYDFFNTIRYWFAGKGNEVYRFYRRLSQCYEDEDYDIQWTPTVTERAEAMLKEDYPDLKAKRGMKLSRLVNRYMTEVIKANEYMTTETVYENGAYVEKPVKPYNKLFAKFADAINPTRQKRWVKTTAILKRYPNKLKFCELHPNILKR